MLFTITGKHIDITEPIRSYAEEKTAKLPRFYSDITEVEVIIDGKEGGTHSVEFIVHPEHAKMTVAKESGDDIYACIDIAVDKLERQLRKIKEKQRNHKHTPAAEQ